MDKIGVFCSASNNIDHVYVERTREFGRWLGQNGKTLVYGGSNQGLMECLAKEVKQNGGRVYGVVPMILEENGRVSELLDVTFRACNLSDRKDTMVAESDIFVALPGGVGTMDEIFHVVAAHSIGYHSKRVILYNINGFYDGLIVVLNQFEALHFTSRPIEQFISVANTLDELKKLLS